MLLTSPQAARRLDVSVRTIHRLVAAGKLTPTQQLPGPNGAFLYDKADVDALLEQRGGAA